MLDESQGSVTFDLDVTAEVRPGYFGIREAPDGETWTGFVSVRNAGRAGYVLIFREANEKADWEYDLPMFPLPRYRASVLGGSGSVSLASGKLHVNIPFARQFVWVRLQSATGE